MTEAVRFYLDPGCPWAWQTSLWIREVENVRDIEVRWRLFSLALANAGPGEPATQDRRTEPALLVLAQARKIDDNAAIARFYDRFGTRVHENREEESVDTVRAAAREAGFSEAEVEAALDDPSLSEVVRADHEEAVGQVGGFGVPTLILGSGKGMFGPVVAKAPTGDAAGELWDRVHWLIEQDDFYELKRNRDRRPGGGKR
ncbi:MAG: hypothetical protein QOK47_1310 [Actinomycetota bacterium]|nr:hypothetical protein [Actinomycetota bacterium]